MKFGTHNKSNMLIISIILASVLRALVIIRSEWLLVVKFDPQQNMINSFNNTLKVVKVWD